MKHYLKAQSGKQRFNVGFYPAIVLGVQHISVGSFTMSGISHQLSRAGSSVLAKDQGIVEDKAWKKRKKIQMNRPEVLSFIRSLK